MRECWCNSLKLVEVTQVVLTRRDGRGLDTTARKCQCIRRHSVHSGLTPNRHADSDERSGSHDQRNKLRRAHRGDFNPESIINGLIRKEQPKLIFECDCIAMQ